MEKLPHETIYDVKEWMIDQVNNHKDHVGKKIIVDNVFFKVDDVKLGNNQK